MRKAALLWRSQNPLFRSQPTLNTLAEDLLRAGLNAMLGAISLPSLDGNCGWCSRKSQLTSYLLPVEAQAGGH
jgi:hypothetical protein